MPGKIASRLAELKVELPKAAAPVANYVPVVITGNQAYVSGQVTVWNGELKYVGQLGKEFQVEDGQKAARICGHNIIAQLQAALGDLDRGAGLWWSRSIADRSFRRCRDLACRQQAGDRSQLYGNAHSR